MDITTGDAPRHVSLDAEQCAWSDVKRLGFGASVGYTILVWLPWMLVSFGFQYPIATATNTLGRWPITHILRLPEHSVGSVWAANNLATFVMCISGAVISVAGAGLWILVDSRRRNHARAFAFVHAFLRYGLAFEMLSYGWDKVLPGQFGTVPLGAGTNFLIYQLGQLTPHDVLWAFMSASRFYQVFTGAIEMFAGVLLLGRSCAPIGALLTIASLTNVLMLDIGYDVSVKFFAGELLLMSAVVMAPYAGAMLQAAKTIAHRAPADVLPPWPVSGRIGMSATAFVAAAVIAVAYADAKAIADDNRSIASQPLHGIWDVEQVSRNGTVLPLVIDDASLWRRIVFPFIGLKASAIVVWMSDAVSRHASSIDAAANTITLDPITNNVVAGSVRGTPNSAALGHQSFTYATPDSDHLVLRSTSGAPMDVVIRLRRFQPHDYHLMQDVPQWRW